MTYVSMKEPLMNEKIPNLTQKEDFVEAVYRSTTTVIISHLVLQIQ